jgi:hypothetical protein
MNPYEAEARTRKATALLATLDAHLAAAPAEVAAVAEAAGPALWELLADVAGTRTPSAATVAEVIRLARRRADRPARPTFASIARERRADAAAALMVERADRLDADMIAAVDRIRRPA